MSNPQVIKKHHSGIIWTYPPGVRGQIVRRVNEVLEGIYGLPRHGNPKNPLDDLIYVLLSNKTPPTRAQTAYKLLKKQFRSWGDLAVADPEQVSKILRPTGFANKRTGQIQGLLQKLKADFGNYSLNDLRSYNE